MTFLQCSQVQSVDARAARTARAPDAHVKHALRGQWLRLPTVSLDKRRPGLRVLGPQRVGGSLSSVSSVNPTGILAEGAMDRARYRRGVPFRELSVA